MARQTGIVNLQGPIGGLSFYKHKHYGWLVRQTNPVGAARIKKDPAFARMRENMSEFGMASSAGKLLRVGFHAFLHEIGREFLDNRIMKLMMAIKDKDAVSDRGKRHVAVTLEAHPELLDDFELNAKHSLAYFTGQNPVVSKQEGTVSLSGFTPQHAPKAATHVALIAFRGRLDFKLNERNLTFSERIVLPLDEVERDVVLSVETPAGAQGVEIWGMKIVYLQEMNGELYDLAVGAAKILRSFGIAEENAGITDTDGMVGFGNEVVDAGNLGGFGDGGGLADGGELELDGG